MANEIVRTLRRSAQGGWRRWSMRSLCRDERPLIRGIATAVELTSERYVAAEDAEWLNRIENLREELCSSSKSLTRLDYGAGSAESLRTRDQMEGGIAVTQTLGSVTSTTSKPAEWALLLFNLIRVVRPKECVEMGTSVGISAAYQAAGLMRNGIGQLTTLEGAAALADIARENFRRLELRNVGVVEGRFQDTLVSVLRDRRPVDYVFIDGHHDELATLTYFETILPYLARPGLLVFDDIAWSKGMKRAWRKIVGSGRVAASVDLGQVGICAIDDRGDVTKRYSFSLG